MDIPEIANLGTGIEMKREVLKLAVEKNLSEGDIWQELNVYRKKTKMGLPTPISSILVCGNSPKNLLERLIGKEIKITESPGEDLLISELQKKKIEFEIKKKIGRYRVDFFFPNKKLIVEIEKDKDIERQLALTKKGYLIIRFSEGEIYKDVQGCIEKILKFIKGELSVDEM